MKEILPEVEAWREAGEKVVVATVVATRRSAPRPVGTSLAVSESGKMCGSVSGGCVESDVYENAMEVHGDRASRSSSTTASPTTWRGRSACPAAARSTSSWSASSEASCPRGCARGSASVEAEPRAVARSPSSRGTASAARRSSSRTASTIGDGVPEEALEQFDELVRGGRNRLLERRRRRGCSPSGTGRRRGCSSTAPSTRPRRCAAARSCSAGRRSSPTRARRS